MGNLQILREFFHISEETFTFICRLYMLYLVRYYMLLPQRREGEVAEDGHQVPGMPCTAL